MAEVSQGSKEKTQRIIHKKKVELLMEIEEKEAKIEEYLNLAKRIKADFENYKKRQEEEKTQLKKIYQREIILEFLNVFDDLERALKEGGKNGEKMIEGVSLVKKAFENVLERANVRRIKTIGCEFSPKFHTAILSVPTKEEKEGIILEEVQSGWTDGDLCLRPAGVIVSGGWKEEALEKAE